MKLKLTIDGQPVPTARPRVTRRGGAFLPARSRQAQTRVQEAAEAAGVTFGDVPVAVRCIFYGPRANSDLDNLAKTVLDGLQKAGTFDDDRQVYFLMLSRVHGVPVDQRRTEIIVSQAYLGDHT